MWIIAGRSKNCKATWRTKNNFPLTINRGKTILQTLNPRELAPRSESDTSCLGINELRAASDRPSDKAGRCPVEEWFNVRTAKALGLTIPIPLLGRADEVIE